MWSNPNGDQIKNIFVKLNKLNLSDDANEIIKITYLLIHIILKKTLLKKSFLNLKAIG